MKDHSENRTENRTNNCKNQSQNRTTSIPRVLTTRVPRTRSNTA